MKEIRSSQSKDKQTPFKFLTIIVTIICAIIISLILLYWHRARVKVISSERDELKQQVLELQTEVLHLHKLVNYNKQADSIRDELTRLTSLINEVEKQVAGRIPKIYCYSGHFGCEGIGYFVAVGERATLSEKVERIAGVLTKYHFHNHPINVLRIEDRNGRKIAIIDLRESEKERAFTWKGGFFQGSSGGGTTTYTLVNTFLQPDYTGKWVDGVEFYYEGKPISKDWDHIFLHGTMYRK